MGMNMKDLSRPRSQFLEAVRRIVIALFQRDRLERYELCPEMVEEPEKAALEKSAAAVKESINVMLGLVKI